MKKLYLLLCFLFVLEAAGVRAQACGFNLAGNDTGCIPMPVLAVATDTNTVIPVVLRKWCLKTCNGIVVFCTSNALNPTFSYVPTVAGCYCLDMISINQAGDTCAFVQCNIQINDTAHFDSISISPTPFCAPQLVTLKMHNTAGCGTITNTQVQWGCGNIANVSGNPDSLTHLYSGLCNPICYNVNVFVANSCGCVAIKHLQSAVCVLPKPVANFSADVTTGVCVSSLTSHFVADSNGVGFTYTWLVNGVQLQSSISRHFIHTFSAAANCYDIQLIAANTTGCADTIIRSHFICVHATPQLAFTLDTPVACQSGLVCAHNMSNPFLPNPVWWVRGGLAHVNLGPFAANDPCFPNLNPGTYTITLIGSYGPGCTDSLTKVFTIGTQVYVNFNVDSNLCPGSTICITNNTTSGFGMTEVWQFGSNIPSYVGHNPPCITYNADGDYPLVYHVSAGTCNRYDTIIMHVHNPELCGYITPDHASCPPLAVCATNCSHHVDSLTDIYTWNFGNGEYLEENPCHYYAYPGCYVVTLSVLTNNGCTDTLIVDTVCVGGPRLSSFTVTPTAICACEDTVHFDMATVGASQLTFVYGCNQGFTVAPINTPGTDSNPFSLHFDIPYCLADSCWPQITLSDSSGCQVLYTLPVVNVDSPVVDFTFNHYGVCTNSTFCFDDSTHYTLPQSYSTSWLWDFGDPYDNTTSTLQNPCHYYSHAGVFPVTLTIHSNGGCVRTITKYVDVHYTGATFGYDSITYRCNYAYVQLHDSNTANAGIVYHSWCYAGQYCDSVNTYGFYFTYQSGNYMVIHEIRDTFGCTAIDTITVPVNIPPYYASLTYVQSGNEVQFTNTSVGNYTNVFWSFGDGDTTGQINPYHLYLDSGMRYVHLYCEDTIHGCLDDTVITLYIPLVLNDTICGYVYYDINNNGTYDAGDIPFAGTVVSTGPYSTTTDSTGYYQLIVDAGTYFIAPAHPAATSFTEPNTSAGFHVTVTVHEHVCNHNFGLTGYTAAGVMADDALQVKITPNPFSDYTTIQLSGAQGEFDFRLVNLLGEEVTSVKLRSGELFRLYRNKLSSGLYLFEIKQHERLLQRGKIVAE